MATPLYKSMKNKGTSMYSFPSAAYDINKPNFRFSKFVLLNIPEQEIVNNPQTFNPDQTLGKLNFDKNFDIGPNFYNFQPAGNADLPTLFSDQMVESLRNYVANYDATLRNSRINSNTDFYNVNEISTSQESIFWKWARKLNILDLEPATHKVDWDKNLDDFDNTNGTSADFFRKYLWKEREINTYSGCTISQDVNVPLITIPQYAKYKVGDDIYVDFVDIGTNPFFNSGDTYNITQVTFDDNSGYTYLLLDVSGYTDSTVIPNVEINLDYHKLVQYIGEISITSNIQTSRLNKQEITAYIHHHAGQTPTILFDIDDNKNYYPGLELPILAIEQQSEIVGAENTNSPIRINPQDYPGTYFGYFDTIDKTYKCSNGDQIRYNGDYYGINLMNNINLDSETHFEKLTNFNSDNIDGLKIDMAREHYLKMNLPDKIINNFDDFNSTTFDDSPEDFEFNTILWYYEIDNGDGNISSNLFGVEFLNNPNNDDDLCDPTYQKITTYKKIVSNDTQDGVSFTFGLNLNYDIDNNNLPLEYDAETQYNQTSLELYYNILKTNYLLQDNFITIINDFTNIKSELFSLRSLIYSQTDIDVIKSQISNLNDLLQLYSTFQFVDSDTAKIETAYEGAYPTLKFNVVDTKYSNIIDANITEIYEYNDIYQENYLVTIPYSNQLLLTIYNDNNIYLDDTTNILLSKDLQYKQSIDIFIKPNVSFLPNNLNININYFNGTTTTNTNLIALQLPIDVSVYNSTTPEDSTFYNSYYNNSNNYTYISTIESGLTIADSNIQFFDNIFSNDDILYIDNFYFRETYTGTTTVTTTVDKSGIYTLTTTVTSGVTTYSILLDLTNLDLISVPKVCYYKGWKINILRVLESNLSTLNDRYKITKELL